MTDNGSSTTVHWLKLGVPYRPEGMEWPTRAHDMARTGSYSPPVERRSTELSVLPSRLMAHVPAPPITVIARWTAGVDDVPATLRLVAVDGTPVPEIVGTSLASRRGLGFSRRSVFRFDGEAVRAVLGEPGLHVVSFQSEAVGGLGGVLHVGETEVHLIGNRTPRFLGTISRRSASVRKE